MGTQLREKLFLKALHHIFPFGSKVKSGISGAKGTWPCEQTPQLPRLSWGLNGAWASLPEASWWGSEGQARLCHSRSLLKQTRESTRLYPSTQLPSHPRMDVCATFPTEMNNERTH